MQSYVKYETLYQDIKWIMDSGADYYLEFVVTASLYSAKRLEIQLSEHGL